MANDKIDMKELKKLLTPLSLLYVEDNTALQEKAALFFEKLFGKVYKASNGQEGLELFKTYRPNIVITDIQMPLIDGLEMAQAMRQSDPSIKIIITSAYDEKRYLLKSIELGLHGYLIKPLKADDLSALLHTLATQINEERSKNLFHNYLYSIFNKQDNLIIMLRHETPLLANDYTMRFFGAPSIKEFRDLFKGFNDLLKPHDTFLYHDPSLDKGVLERIKEDMDKLYNVKMIDAEGKAHHFILKLNHISEDEDLYILALTDITELNLLNLYDKNAAEHDNALKDERIIQNLLQAAKDAGAVIKLYNFYKGLMITNNAVLVRVDSAGCILKTSQVQQKAIHYEQKVILNCELFPYDIQSFSIKANNFSNQSVETGPCVMLKTTPSARQSLILEPDPKHKVTLFYDDHKFDTHTLIKDVSKEAVRINIEYLPAGMKEGDEVSLSMVFSDELKPIIINTKATIYRILTMEKSFDIITKLLLTPRNQQTLIDYLAARQMKLVREFKGMQCPL